jgi:hypothetical protein
MNKNINKMTQDCLVAEVNIFPCVLLPSFASFYPTKDTHSHFEIREKVEDLKQQETGLSNNADGVHGAP